MKILLITKRIPFPPNSGYPIVVYNTMKGLLQLGADITLFSLNPANSRLDLEDISDPIFEKIKTHTHDLDTEVNVWAAFFNIFTNESYNVSRYYNEDAARQLENVLRENTFDIIQFEGLFVVPYLDVVKANSNAKLIYRAHNIEFTMWERLSHSESFLIRRKYFLGAMDWRPNQEGLEWFLDDIWPDIEKLNKDLRFYIAGKNMQKHFFEYDSDNLIVEGEVFDAVEFMNSKAIMIVPLISGTGMRVKIIEGMAMKKCIIATTTAAEGINCRHGHDILIADSADEFYRSILQCVINPKRWLEIGENARKTVENEHGVHLISSQMLNIYEDLISVKAD
ncbi:MAG: glycosyltransferase [Pedobacter sp.]|nr:MAG: glycosyltransferase [Pedobacter sp.]